MSRSGRSSNGDRLSPPSTSLSTNHEIPVIFDQDAYRESVNRDMDESFLVEDPSLTDLQQRRGGRDQASDSDSDDDDNNSNDGDNTVDFQELRRMVEDGEIDDRDFEEELERVQEV